MMDVGLHHRRVHPHPSSSGYALVTGYPHYACMNLFEHLRPERQAPTAHRLGIRCLAAAYMGEVPVHQISPHLPLQHLIAPVPDVFEHQQSQYHVGRCTPAATATVLGMPFKKKLPK